MAMIRAASSADSAAIGRLVTAAFDQAPHSDGNEAAIVAGLRRAGALTVSLVAECAGLAGYVAFSPVRIEGASGWYGLGPVAVLPGRQGGGVGSELIRAGLAQLQAIGAAGSVVLGNPGYYRRFGFRADPGLVLEGVPAEFFLARLIGGPAARGSVAYHPAFFAQ